MMGNTLSMAILAETKADKERYLTQYNTYVVSYTDLIYKLTQALKEVK